MPLTLILMRHAKSSWDDPLQDDFDRGLNDRGRKSASAIGKWLKEHAYTPNGILCSSAVRARETLDELALDAPTTYLADLYLASPTIMSRAIKNAQANRLLLIAHNPGMALLAEELARAPADHPRFHDYPTAATTVLEFDIDTWSDLAPRTGTIRDFIVPRDLIGP